MTEPPITLEDAKIEGVEVVSLIAVYFPRGSGVAPSAYRMVTQYWTMEGELVFEVDPWINGEDVPA